MLLAELIKWFFINVMVVLGVTSLISHPAVLRWWKHTPAVWPRAAVSGGLVACFSMLFPLPIGPGQFLDVRQVPLGLVGWQYGWRGYVGAAVPMVAVRLWMGGVGALGAVTAIALQLPLTLLFVGRLRTVWSLTAMGLVETTARYLVFSIIGPVPNGWGPASPNWAFLAAAHVLGNILLSAFVDHVESRVMLEDSLAAQLATKAAVLELIPFGIAFLDAGGRVTDANQAARDLMRGPALPDEILARASPLKALAEDPRTQGHRVEFTDGSGVRRHVMVSVNPIERGVIVGLENVTGVVVQEREEAHKDRLKLLGQLSAMAAHEIKNPLTTIQGFVQLMESNPQLSVHQSTFSLLHREADHINRVVSDFTLLSRQLNDPAESVSVDELLERICRGTAVQHPHSPVHITWEGEEGITVIADGKALPQILRNLVANAYEAMPGGGHLRLMRERKDEMVRIAVADSGPGISQEMLPLIFQPYTTTKSTGSGLGLTISRKLAMEMGGSLDVTARPGAGSTFTLQIPQAPRFRRNMAGGSDSPAARDPA